MFCYSQDLKTSQEQELEPTYFQPTQRLLVSHLVTLFPNESAVGNTTKRNSLNTRLLNIQEDRIHSHNGPEVTVFHYLFKTLVLSIRSVWTVLSVLLFYTGKIQAFAHPASVTDCNTDLRFETLNLAGTPSGWEELCVKERMNVEGYFTVIFLLHLAFAIFKARECQVTLGLSMLLGCENRNVLLLYPSSRSEVRVVLKSI